MSNPTPPTTPEVDIARCEVCERGACDASERYSTDAANAEAREECYRLGYELSQRRLREAEGALRAEGVAKNALAAEVERLTGIASRLIDGISAVIVEGTSRGDKDRGINAACLICNRATPPGGLMADELLHWPHCPIGKLLALAPAKDAGRAGRECIGQPDCLWGLHPNNVHAVGCPLSAQQLSPVPAVSPTQGETRPVWTGEAWIGEVTPTAEVLAAARQTPAPSPETAMRDEATARSLSGIHPGWTREDLQEAIVAALARARAEGQATPEKPAVQPETATALGECEALRHPHLYCLECVGWRALAEGTPTQPGGEK